MADNDLKVTNFKRWDDMRLQQDGTAKAITRIRYWLGSHGPFEGEFDRDVDVYVIEQHVTNKRTELTRLAAL